MSEKEKFVKLEDFVTFDNQLVYLKIKKAFWDAIQLNAKNTGMSIGDYLSLWIDEEMCARFIYLVDVKKEIPKISEVMNSEEARNRPRSFPDTDSDASP